MMRISLFVFSILFSASSWSAAFTNQDGKPVTPGDWNGRPVIVSVAYTTCPTTCSFTVENLRKLEAALGKDSSKVEFKVFTVDPLTDTPEILKAYKNKLGVKWEFLTGDRKSVREYLMKFNLSFGEKSMAGNHIMHPNVILLVEPDGKSWHEATGISPDFTKMVQTIRKFKASSTER